MTQLNTHSMPILLPTPRSSAYSATARPADHLAALLVMVLLAGWLTPLGALAGIQRHQAELEKVLWEVVVEEERCALSHDIPLYGRAAFVQNIGEELRFTMTVKQPATRNKDMARLRSLPPAWKHQNEAVDLEEVAVIKGDTPFQLEQRLALRLLDELEKGMFPTFSYRDWTDAEDLVSVSLPGIHFKDALEQFQRCLAGLPVLRFGDFQNTSVNFAFGKASLDKQARKNLDNIARYIKTDKQVRTIEISGHTDDIGKPGANDSLGNRRSEAVRDYLLAKGIRAELFKLISFGERQPVAANSSDGGRAQNRRALVTLVK